MQPVRVSDGHGAMQLNLCYELFCSAGRASLRGYPRWVLGKTDHVGPETAPAPRPSCLVFGSEEQLLGASRYLASGIFRDAFCFTDQSYMDRRERLLVDLLAQLFLPYSNYPAFVWAATRAAASSSSLRLLSIRPVDRVLRTAFDLPRRAEIVLRFDAGESVTVALDRMPFARADGRGPGEMKPLLVSRTRSGRTTAGKEFTYGLEESLGLVDQPGDFDGYFPAHHDFTVRDGAKNVVYSTANSLFLARLRPRGTFERAWIQYIPLPLHPHDARPIAISAVRRDFARFVQSYPGIADLLWQHVLGERHEPTK